MKKLQMSKNQMKRIRKLFNRAANNQVTMSLEYTDEFGEWEFSVSSICSQEEFSQSSSSLDINLDEIEEHFDMLETPVVSPDVDELVGLLEPQLTTLIFTGDHVDDDVFKEFILSKAPGLVIGSDEDKIKLINPESPKFNIITIKDVYPLENLLLSELEGNNDDSIVRHATLVNCMVYIQDGMLRHGDMHRICYVMANGEFIGRYNTN